MTTPLKLDDEQKKALENGISMAQTALQELDRLERTGVNVSIQRKQLLDVIERNQKLLVEFG